jgi:hypothetical protein
VRKRAIAWAITITAVAILGPGSGMAGAKERNRKTETVKCHISLIRQSSPTASTPGEDFGFVTCSGPFGEGVQHDTFTLMPRTSTTGTATLKFKAYFDSGTVSGEWDATYVFTSASTGTFAQKVKWTSGTGAFKHVKGTGSGTGTQNGARSTVTQTIKVTGI